MHALKSQHKYTMHSLVTAALLGCAQASICYPEYQAIFHWLNSRLTSEFTYDLRPLCGGGSSGADTGNDLVFYVPIPADPTRNWTMIYSIGGNTSQRCNPNWLTYSSGGSFQQQWDSDKAYAGRGLSKRDPETGLNVSITPPCELIATNRPEFDIVDEANPQFGGIALKYDAMPDSASDGNKCPNDPRYGGGPGPRQLTLLMNCDPLMDPSQILPVSWTETSPCKYTMVATSGAACGVAGDPYAALFANEARQAAPSAAGVQFGYTILGGCLFAALQYAFVSGLVGSLLTKVGLPSYGLHVAPAARGYASTGGGAAGLMTSTSSSGAYGSVH